MHRPRAGSVRLPLYDPPPRYNARPDDPDSALYRQRTQRARSARRRCRLLQTYAAAALGALGLARARSLAALLRWAALALLSAGLVVTLLWEIHVEVMVYSRAWIEAEVRPVEPLAGCFEKAHVSKLYNITAAFAPKRHEVQAGLPLRLGMDCYEFASSIQRDTYPHGPHGHDALAIPAWTPHYPGGPRIYFHTYWRTDLVAFEERQEWLLKSFFATQDLTRSTLVLWSNLDTLRANPRVARWLKAFPDNFEYRVVNTRELARGTVLEDSPLLQSSDNRAWVDGDLVRLLVTWAVGGVWIDMDSLLIRDLSPLLEHEFVTQWDCYDKLYQPFNGAMMHFFQHSPYLCEAFHIMRRSPAPRSGTTDWGSTLYLKMWRRLAAASIPPFKVLPFCFTDARSCRHDNRLPDPFKPDPPGWAGAGAVALVEGGKLDETLHKIFSVHLHNQWDKKFPKGGWVERLLLRRYELHLPDP